MNFILPSLISSLKTLSPIDIIPIFATCHPATLCPCYSIFLTHGPPFMCACARALLDIAMPMPPPSPYLPPISLALLFFLSVFQSLLKSNYRILKMFNKTIKIIKFRIVLIVVNFIKFTKNTNLLRFR